MKLTDEQHKYAVSKKTFEIGFKRVFPIINNIFVVDSSKTGRYHVLIGRELIDTKLFRGCGKKVLFKKVDMLVEN